MTDISELKATLLDCGQAHYLGEEHADWLAEKLGVRPIEIVVALLELQHPPSPPPPPGGAG